MKKLCTLALSTIGIAVLASSVSAADNVKISVNGSFIDFTGDQPPIIQNGRTLVPFRAVFEKIGAVVDWNEYTKVCTASYNGKTVGIAIDNTAVTVNGKIIAQSDVPAQIINNRTMVPVRVLSENLGLNVAWDNKTKTVSVRVVSETPQQDIGEEKAVSIALEDAGVDAAEAMMLNVKLDREYSGNVYDVEFRTPTMEYDYEIDAATGKILSVDKDAESIQIIPAPVTPTVPQEKLSDDDALQTALKDAGLDKTQVSRIKVERDFDDGIEKYEVEFVLGRTEYSYEINAATGDIIGKEIDND